MEFSIQVIQTKIGPDMPLDKPLWITLNSGIESREKADYLLSLQRRITPRATFRIVEAITPDFLPA
jgi:hypothetical protein